MNIAAAGEISDFGNTVAGSYFGTLGDWQGKLLEGNSELDTSKKGYQKRTVHAL